MNDKYEELLAAEVHNSWWLEKEKQGLPPTHCSEEEAAETALNAMLIEENRAMREAGCELAEAAIRVVREHDGCHRLMLAVSKWAKTIANEGGRKKMYYHNA